MPLLSGSTCRRRRRQPPVVVDIGCNCRKLRLLGSLFSSLTSRGRGGCDKPKSPHASLSSTTTAFTSSTAGATTATAVSSVDSWGPATYTTNTLYEDDVESRRERRRRQQRRRRREQAEIMAREEEAVAVAVESAAPYEDFRESMVAMVVEKEMYAWEDLTALLHRFLSLNSPRHHPLILHAFADLWARAAASSPLPPRASASDLSDLMYQPSIPTTA